MSENNQNNIYIKVDKTKAAQGEVISVTNINSSMSPQILYYEDPNGNTIDVATDYGFAPRLTITFLMPAYDVSLKTNAWAK